MTNEPSSPSVFYFLLLLLFLTRSASASDSWLKCVFEPLGYFLYSAADFAAFAREGMVLLPLGIYLCMTSVG